MHVHPLKDSCWLLSRVVRIVTTSSYYVALSSRGGNRTALWEVFIFCGRAPSICKLTLRKVANDVAAYRFLISQSNHLDAVGDEISRSSTMISFLPTISDLSKCQEAKFSRNNSLLQLNPRLNTGFFPNWVSFLLHLNLQIEYLMNSCKKRKSLCATFNAIKL